jgi:dihydroorotase
MIEDLNKRGIDVTTEAYPYTAGMTRLDSGVFEPGWDKRLRIGPGDLEWIDTGERLTWENFESKRAEGGLVAVHAVSPDVVDLVIGHERVMIASDSIPYTPDGKSHPRSAGTFSRVLGQYVRDRSILTLPLAIKKMTLMPAQRLEGVAPVFKRKGRLQVGCDADIVVFDPATITDNATFAQPMVASTGVKELLVGGVRVISEGALTGARPGKACKSAS